MKKKGRQIGYEFHQITLLQKHNQTQHLDPPDTDTDTQTHRHTDTQTHRHTDTQTHTGAQRGDDTGGTHTHTHTHTHTAPRPPRGVRTARRRHGWRPISLNSDTNFTQPLCRSTSTPEGLDDSSTKTRASPWPETAKMLKPEQLSES
jgi:hypothetical protein